ncbi:FmdB family zinc ribbon protein [Candidatus Margulisiibacteriota bacterium]
MPYYDYKCVKCSHKFEVQKGMNDLVFPECPKCYSPAQRIFSCFRTKRSDKDILDSAGSEQSSSCSTCSSGVCSTCGVNK